MQLETDRDVKRGNENDGGKMKMWKVMAGVEAFLQTRSTENLGTVL